MHFLRLLLLQTLALHLSNVVVVGNHVRVLEEYDCVGKVALDAMRTVGISTFVASKNDLMGSVALYFAKRFHLLGLVSWLGLLLLRHLFF